MSMKAYSFKFKFIIMMIFSLKILFSPSESRGQIYVMETWLTVINQILKKWERCVIAGF